MKNKIRPLYSELQGCLAQAPPIESRSGLSHPSIWMQYNEVVEQLKALTQKDYERFLITGADTSSFRGERWVDNTVYRSKLGGLIATLYGEYFSDEPAPFAGMPSTVITTTQMQSQSVDIQMLLAIQSKIDEQIARFTEGSKERNFLQKLKGSLTGVKDATQLLSQLVIAAKGLGISVDDLFTIFS